MSEFLRALLGTLVLSASISANASLITIDPADYAPGTNLSLEDFDGVRFLTFSSPPGDTSYSYSSVYAATESGTGQTVFGHTTTAAFGGEWNETLGASECFRRSVDLSLCADTEPFRVMLIAFDQATDYVEMSGRTETGDTVLLWAFDAYRNLLGNSNYNRSETCLQPSGSGSGCNFLEGTTWFDYGEASISYVIAAGWDANSSLDVLRYRATSQRVPEPGTLALLGLGLVGMGYARRRRAA